MGKFGFEREGRQGKMWGRRRRKNGHIYREKNRWFDVTLPIDILHK